MSCNCTPVCQISRCVELLTIGVLTPDTTVTVQFKDIITGRIRQVIAESDGDGLLVVDVSEISAFFSENFVYELSLLAANTNQCNTTNFTVGETEIACAQVTFAAYSETECTLAIDSPIVPEFDDYRITEEGELRITEDSNNRILE